MNSRTLVNLFLALFLIIAGSWFYYSKNRPPEIVRLTTLDIDEITQILIPKDNDQDILLIKDPLKNTNEQWRMLKPYNINAHQFRVNTLLGLSQTPVDNFYDISTLKLTDYSFERPRAKITFNKTQVLFGKSNPINARRYILTENKMALLLDQTYPLVSAHAATFIDLSILPHSEPLLEISLPKFTLTKNKNNSWQTNTDTDIDKENLLAIKNHWKQAQAFSVHPYLERKELGRISIKTTKQTINFIINDDNSWLILARPDMKIEYHLDISFKEKLLGNFTIETNNA